ncbi:hypothetical protein GCM10007385_22590 [Tateyamaria omphalii]|nr:hypothetical protein GCM10007385_22590 [Tateyamaria omphalii]
MANMDAIKIADGDAGPPVACINKLVVPNDLHAPCLAKRPNKGKDPFLLTENTTGEAVGRGQSPQNRFEAVT